MEIIFIIVGLVTSIVLIFKKKIEGVTLTIYWLAEAFYQQSYMIDSDIYSISLLLLSIASMCISMVLINRKMGKR